MKFFGETSMKSVVYVNAAITAWNKVPQHDSCRVLRKHVSYDQYDNDN